MMRTRILAAATAALLALGMAAGGASPALANGNPDNLNDPNNWETLTGEVCYKVEPVTPPYVLPANTPGYTYSQVIVKAGSSGNSVTNENAVYTTDSTGGALTPGDSFVHPEKDSISHVIVCEIPAEPGVATASIDLTDPDCFVGAMLDEGGFTYTNSTYVIVDSGAGDGSYEVVFTANSGFEFAGGETELTFTGTLAGPSDDPSCEEQPGVATASIALTDPTCEVGETLDESLFGGDNSTYVIVDDGSEDGTYEVVFTAEDGFEFAGGETELTFTGSLAGPSDDPSCEEQPGVATASIALTDPDCFFGETLDEGGFGGDNSTYVIVDDGSEDGTYEVVFTAEDGFEFAGGETELTFTGTLAGPNEGDECVLPITDAFLAFIDPTCDDREQLDPENFIYDPELAELTILEVEENGDFLVVFETIGEDTQFFQELEGDFSTADHNGFTRTVEEGGTVLVFEGTLAGPNTELCEDEVVVVPPVTVVDDCFEQSYTITAVEGVSYAVSVNGSLPMGVSFEEGEDTATFGADPFDEIVVIATADEGYALDEGYEPFEYTYAFDEDCLPTAPVTTASVTWTQADCLGNPGSYTLTNEPGVIWTVDGVVVAGNTKYTAAVGSTPSIVASLEPASEEFPTGFGWSNPAQQTLWNLVFEAADDCLPTLALTGASNALGGLGVVAILIMMAGTGLVVARRREAVRIQG